MARELFELFKTPWEFYRPGQNYDVALCVGDVRLDGVSARLLIVYAGMQTEFDKVQRILPNSERTGSILLSTEGRLPIYGGVVTFRHEGKNILSEENSRESVSYVVQMGGKTVARVGYDLFDEVRILLTQGQPAANAAIPALDMHIAILRNLITGAGLPLVEIPPVPAGYPFMACLTHDVDHASIRRHRFDRTMFGFLYRATLGSIINAARGRLPLRKLGMNWAAAAKLPLVHLGLAADFWFEFDRYVELEKGLPSTFFVIPFEGEPGRRMNGPAPRARAARYDITHIAEKLPELQAAGCEIALHGIDAWMDASAGQEEVRRIAELAGAAEVGVRTHWLYGNGDSPANLDAAGFAYDSSVGYNETVGYRAGTGQAYKPFQAAKLLELPLHVMDTALFYPDYLNLSEKEAWSYVSPLLNNAIRHGGGITVNWHDRSISPERLWGDFYLRLLEALAERGAWCCTAGQAVAWFRKRRTAVVENVRCEGGELRARVASTGGEHLPGLRLRFHPAQKPAAPSPDANRPPTYTDFEFQHYADVHLPN